MKRLLVSVIVLIALVGAGAALRWQISSEAAIRRMAATLVPGAAERKIVIGHTGLRYFPRLAITFDDVAISAADESARLTVPSARADLDILPLFIGETRISRLHLEAPELDIRAPFSLDGLLPDRALMAAMPPASVVVHKGTLRLHDTASGASEVFTDVETNVRWPRPLGNLSLDASATWRGSPVSLLVQGLSPPRLASGDTGDLDVNLRMPGLDALFSGRATLSDRLILDGRLTASIDDPRETAGYFHFVSDAGQTGLPPLPAISLDGRLRSQGWLMSLNDAHIRLGDAAADGFLSLQCDTPRPQLRGTLAFGAVKVVPSGEEASLGAWLDWTPDLDGFRELDLDLRFSITRALFGDVRAANMAASLLMSDGQIYADIGDAQIFGGNGSVILRGGPEADAVGLSGRYGLTNASIPTLRQLMPVAIVPQLGGTLNLSGDFRTRGRNLRTLLSGLSGQAQIETPKALLEHLATPALTVAALGSDVAHALASRLVLSPKATAIKAALRFAGPNLTFESIALSLADVELRLTGKASLVDRTIDLLGTLRLPPPDTGNEETPADPPTADVSLVGTLDAAVVAVRDRPAPKPE